MNARTKMMLLNNHKDDGEEMRRGRKSERYEMSPYEHEDDIYRRRGSRTRMTYDDPYYDDDAITYPRMRGNGRDGNRTEKHSRNYTSRNYDMGDMDSYFPDMRRYESNYDTSVNMPEMPYRSPRYMNGQEERMNRDDKIEYPARRLIGYAPSESHDYYEEKDYNTMGETKMEYMPLTKEQAEKWVANMKNADGTTGPHWSMDQIKNVMAQHHISGSPWVFYAAMNATYSDLSEFFKKQGISNINAYVDYVKCFWMNDEDAVGKGVDGGKLSAYYHSVVQH